MYVDDYIPCRTKGTTPAFSEGNDNELWVVLLEKAWAKLHASYVGVVAGFSYEAFRDLTGAPSYFYYNQERDNMFTKVL